MEFLSANARKFLLENADACERLAEAVYAHHGLKRIPVAVVAEEPEVAEPAEA